MQSIKGQFLCISNTEAPQVHILSSVEMETFDERLRIASKRDSARARAAAYMFAFGFACDYAIPCWVPAAIEAIALNYPQTAPYADAVRYLAASITLGETFGADRGDSDEGGDGGLKVESAKPVPEIPPSGASRLFSSLNV